MANALAIAIATTGSDRFPQSQYFIGERAPLRVIRLQINSNRDFFQQLFASWLEYPDGNRAEAEQLDICSSQQKLFNAAVMHRRLDDEIVLIL